MSVAIEGVKLMHTLTKDQWLEIDSKVLKPVIQSPGWFTWGQKDDSELVVKWVDEVATLALAQNQEAQEALIDIAATLKRRKTRAFNHNHLKGHTRLTVLYKRMQSLNFNSVVSPELPSAVDKPKKIWGKHREAIEVAKRVLPKFKPGARSDAFLAELSKSVIECPPIIPSKYPETITATKAAPPPKRPAPPSKEVIEAMVQKREFNQEFLALAGTFEAFEE